MDQPSSPFKVPASPVTPLQQLSPDRINQQRISASPSLPNQLSSTDVKLSRQSMDVQSKVAFINSLNQAGSPSRQQGSSAHAALQRALLGREEAENALRNSHTQLAEADLRQRKISERLESFMDELQAVKERQAHERQVFEKEVRKARKDAFRAGSTVVKLQEDLKEARAEVKTLKAETQHEKFEKEKSKQEAFERAYTLAGLLEEVEVMREKMRSMEAAREAEALEQQSRKLQQDDEALHLTEERRGEQEEPAAQLEEAQIPPEVEDADEAVPLRQNRFERDLPAEGFHSNCIGVFSTGADIYSSDTLGQGRRHGLDVAQDEKLGELEAELQWEKKLRTRAEDMVHFLQMECHFKTCACRVAERNGTTFVHDKVYHESTKAAPTESVEEAQEAVFSESEAKKSSTSAHETHVPEEDMFNISRATHHRAAEPTLDRPPFSSPKASPSPKPEPPSPIASSISITSAHAPSSDLDHLTRSPSKNTSSPAILEAEDMTYQSPLHTMPRPKSACSAPLRHFPASPAATGSPSTSPYPPIPSFKTPQRPGLRLVHTTTTMMVPLRDSSNDDDVFSPAPLATPGTPISREAALAQIRARRDRARSVAAVATTSRSAPGSARRGLVVSGGGGLREVSVISAPGRF